MQGLGSDQLTRWVELHLEREQQWAAMLGHLMETRPADLTAVVFDGVDRIQHLCLHLLVADPSSLDREGRRTRDACLGYFRLVDSFLGDLVRRAEQVDGTVLVVSDHGSCVAGDRIFYANTWLEREGLLRWADGVQEDDAGRLALDGNAESGGLFDWEGTRVAALTSSSNALVVRRSCRPGDGGVTPDELPGFVRRLSDRLLDARDSSTGEPIVAGVMTGPETFPGQASGDAPDLTLELCSPGFLSVLRGAEVFAPRPTPYGTRQPGRDLRRAGTRRTGRPARGPAVGGRRDPDPARAARAAAAARTDRPTGSGDARAGNVVQRRACGPGTGRRDPGRGCPGVTRPGCRGRGARAPAAARLPGVTTCPGRSSEESRCTCSSSGPGPTSCSSTGWGPASPSGTCTPRGSSPPTTA